MKNVNDIVTVAETERETKKIVATKPVTTEKSKTKREVKKYTFIEGDIIIPHKIACSKCGKLVSGLPSIIAERIKNKYNNSWEQYKKEWQCSDCANADKKAEKSKKQTELKNKKIEEAIKLLQSEGYEVTK